MSEPVTVSLRARVSHADAHYGGGLVSGARLLELVHDVATELCIRNDEDEGLFAGYSSVDFLAPVRAGDFLEATGAIVRIGNRSREMTFEIVRYARQRPELSETAATVLERPEVVLTARGTCVVPRGRS
jgi:3-aminobutyryl-CoA ammonia-lyase